MKVIVCVMFLMLGVIFLFDLFIGAIFSILMSIQLMTLVCFLIKLLF